MLRFFSVYSKLGAAKAALDNGEFWIDEVDDVDQLSQRSLDEVEEGLEEEENFSEDGSHERSSPYSPVLEFEYGFQDEELDVLEEEFIN